MTVNTSVRRADYVGAGSTGPYAYPFRIMAAGHLRVTKYITATGAATVLLEDFDYTITGVGDGMGGSITLIVALPTGTTLVLERATPYLQTVEVRNQGAFFAQIHEDAWDLLEFQVQQIADGLASTFRAPHAIPPASLLTEIASFIAGNYLRVNLAGTGIEGVAAVVAAQNFLQSGTGAVVRSANAKMASRLTIEDFGAFGNNSVNCTPAVNQAVQAAYALGINTIGVEGSGGGRYRFATPLDELTSAIYFEYAGSASGGVANHPIAHANFFCEGNTPTFVMTGRDAVKIGGYGARNIRFVKTGGANCNAVDLLGLSSSQWPIWPRFDNCFFEEDGVHSWNYALNVDSQGHGDGNGSLDWGVIINNCETHVSGAGGAYRLNGVLGAFLTRGTCSLNGTVSIGDTNLCEGVNLNGMNIGTLICDHARDTQGYLPVATAITNTANTDGAGLIICGRLVTPFVDNSGGHMTVMSLADSTGAFKIAGGASRLLATGAGHTVDDVITALQAQGWFKQL